MSTVLRHLPTLNNAAKILELKLQRSLILTPSVSAIVFEILTSFP